MKMREYWLKINCPKCEKINWACDASSYDVIKPPIEAVKCWSCEHGFWVDEALARDYYVSSMAELEDDKEPMSLDQILETYAYFTLGRETPENPNQPRRF